MFCERCGNELVDEAVVCTKCGCFVANNQQKAKKIENPKKSFDFFSWASFILAIIALFDAIINCVIEKSTSDFLWFIYSFNTYLCVGAFSILSILLSFNALRKKSNIFSLLGLSISCLSILINLILNISFFA